MKQCKVCNKEIQRKPSRQLGAKFCSIPCYHKYQRDKAKKKEYVCKNCCGKYWLFPSRTRYGRTTRFCSAECMSDWKSKLFNSPRAKRRREIMKGAKMRSVDNLFSKIVRSQTPYCERCKKTTSLQCSHVIPRTYITTRWDIDNAITLCYACHIHWWHKNPHEAVKWFDERWPGRYEQLKARANQKHTRSREEEYLRLKEIAKQEDIQL